ncbi:hypothetical protein [Metapseudomonas otitidis]|uniref:hypothetical protein n=1 Tax=Metapseudomonas otitidis TaxID=319939 RepID=UPI0013F68EBE|nr:hypothetical protein [Pseudomonas otitidis]
MLIERDYMRRRDDPIKSQRQHSQPVIPNGYWLPPKPWKARLYRIFGMKAPGRWVSLSNRRWL